MAILQKRFTFRLALRNDHFEERCDFVNRKMPRYGTSSNFLTNGVIALRNAHILIINYSVRQAFPKYFQPYSFSDLYTKSYFLHSVHFMIGVV